MDLYSVLGVPSDASAEEIKRAYRQAALKHHPDVNPGAGKAAHARFHEVQEAYSVLRDEGKRAQYDRMRAAGWGAMDREEAAAGGGYGTPWGQPSMDTHDFDRHFEEWFKKMSDEFRDYEGREFARERTSAERMAKAAAWQWEKEQAQLNKVRAQQVKWRTEDARLQRHATMLRRFWQTHAGFTLGDALFLGAFFVGAAGIALGWRAHLQEIRQQQHIHQEQQQQQQQSALSQQQPQDEKCDQQWQPRAGEPPPQQQQQNFHQQPQEPHQNQQHYADPLQPVQLQHGRHAASSAGEPPTSVAAAAAP